MEIRRYTWKRNDENAEWHNGVFETIAGCAEEAKASGARKGETILVGEALPYIPYVEASEVLERLKDDAYECLGEIAETWEPELAGEKETDELSDRLTDCVKEWLSENGVEPGFFAVDEIREMEIK